MTRRVTLLVVTASVLVASVLAVAVTRGPGSNSGPGTTGGASATEQRARDFLDTYVDDTGRVVRTDQGGDTVSEGQAYAMLIAVGSDDRGTFDRVWGWTQSSLLRPDGLLSWKYDDGAITDASSAADADLDAARALVLAGAVFDEPGYVDRGVALGTAILDHETVQTPDGLVLVAGSWALNAPYAFNPSYVSPVATQLLGKASGDRRWAELSAGSRSAVEAVTPGGQLPPDWAEIDADGAGRAVPGPAGQPVQFGYDAARTLIRQAESCDQADRAIAADAGAVLGEDRAVAVYDLAGSPQTRDVSPLTLVAQAAGFMVRGEDAAAQTSIDEARAAQRATPTYYGDAWAVLGPMLLADDTLGGCATLVAS